MAGDTTRRKRPWRARHLHRLGHARPHPHGRRRRREHRPRDWTQAVTSVAALGALVITALSLYLTSRQNGHQNAIAEQGQITERYSATINQLGSSTEDIRIGGIYALRRLMNDSPADQPAIVEVLAAFVRNHPPGSPHATAPVKPPADVDAALSVISWRDLAHDGRSTFIALNGTDFSHLSLRVLRFTNANLDHAGFTGADLYNADLSATTLTGARLDSADLTGATLTDANLHGADLRSANLAFALLNRADLQNADLTDANLDHTTLTDANLWGTSLCSGTEPTTPDLGYFCLQH